MNKYRQNKQRYIEKEDSHQSKVLEEKNQVDGHSKQIISHRQVLKSLEKWKSMVAWPPASLTLEVIIKSQEGGWKGKQGWR